LRWQLQNFYQCSHITQLIIIPVFLINTLYDLGSSFLSVFISFHISLERFSQLCGATYMGYHGSDKPFVLKLPYLNTCSSLFLEWPFLISYLLVNSSFIWLKTQIETHSVKLYWANTCHLFIPPFSHLLDHEYLLSIWHTSMYAWMLWV